MTFQSERAQQLALEISRIDALLEKGVPRAYQELERGRLDFNLTLVLPGRSMVTYSQIFDLIDSGQKCNAVGCLLGWARVAMPELRGRLCGEMPDWFGHPDADFEGWFSARRLPYPDPRDDLDERVSRIRQARDEKAAELAEAMGVAA